MNSKKKILNSKNSILNLILMIITLIFVIYTFIKIKQSLIKYIKYAKEKGCSMTGTEDLNIERLNVLI